MCLLFETGHMACRCNHGDGILKKKPPWRFLPLIFLIFPKINDILSLAAYSLLFERGGSSDAMCLFDEPLKMKFPQQCLMQVRKKTLKTTTQSKSLPFSPQNFVFLRPNTAVMTRKNVSVSLWIPNYCSNAPWFQVGINLNFITFASSACQSQWWR